MHRACRRRSRRPGSGLRAVFGSPLGPALVQLRPEEPPTTTIGAAIAASSYGLTRSPSPPVGAHGPWSPLVIGYKRRCERHAPTACIFLLRGMRLDLCTNSTVAL